MAAFYADANGALIAFAENFFVSQGPEFAGAKAAAAFTVDFDESTNAALVVDIQANLKQYAAPSGVLKKSGATVSITAASAIYAILGAVISGVPKSTLEAFIVALWNGTATTAQTQKAIAYLAVLLHVKLGLV